MTKPNRPALIVFGKRPHKAPRAAWFIAVDTAVAQWIGQRYAMSILKVDGNFMRSLSSPIEGWELSESGPPVLPVARLEVFEELKARASDASNLLTADAVPSGVPTATSATSAVTATQRREAANVLWGALAVRSLVLAMEDPPAEGWWEAIILSMSNSSCILYYRDHPDQGLIKRDVRQLSLLPPNA